MHLVVFIHDISCVGGTTTVATTLANNWAKQGIKISILTFGYASCSYYPLDKSIKIIATNIAKTSSGILSQITVNFMRVFRINKILKKIKPNIVLAIGAIPSTILALVKRDKKNYIAIGSEHQNPATYPLNIIAKLIRRWSYKYLDALVALTKYSKQWIIKNTKANLVSCIANPLNYPLTVVNPQINPKSILTNNKKTLIAAGHLEFIKGFDMLINAFSSISKKYCNWQLVILGEGTQRIELEQQIIKLDLQNKILLPGYVGNIADWYEIADVFVFSSRYEGLPCALMEAMAYGLPAISFDCLTGPSDIITHNIDGLLVENNNSQKLAKYLDKLMSDEALRKQFATEAIKVRNRFNINVIEKQWNNLFDKLQQKYL